MGEWLSQWSAKPFTAVRIRFRPRKAINCKLVAFFVSLGQRSTTTVVKRCVTQGNGHYNVVIYLKKIGCPSEQPILLVYY